MINNVKAKAAAIDVGASAAGVSILGCFIGTKANGGGDVTGGTGIIVRGTATIGNPFVPADLNIISGSNTIGIDLRGPSSTVRNNLIGTDAAGTAFLGNGVGIQISTAAAVGNAIGGGQGNVIANSFEDGIRVLASASNSIQGNDIRDSGDLGIDLGDDGVTENDENDVDNGPNGLQNFPVLTFARSNGTTLSVEDYLNSQPGTYGIDLFQNSEPDPSGFGEGEVFAGSGVIEIPDGETIGFFKLALVLPVAPVNAFFVSATAERADTGAVSEFSRTIDAAPGGTVLTVTNSTDNSVGSLREVILTANLNADINTIVFAIPPPVQAIRPVTGLVITQPVIIDGYTQAGALTNTLANGSDAQPVIVIDGSLAAGSTSAFVVNSPGCVIRGLVIHSFSSGGIRGINAPGLRIKGNFIGTDATGTQDLGNDGDGVFTGSGAGIVIGGAAPAQRNILSGNGGSGVVDGGSGTRVAGNIIGSSARGGDLGNGADGITVTGDDAVIGGDDAGSGNLIRSNAQAGITVASGTANRILANSIFENGVLGIDLDPQDSPGVTDNDEDDSDTGANNRQNFPVLEEVNPFPGQLKITGTLDVPDATSEATYTIRVFESAACDSSGHGEGEIFLGAADVVLSGNDEVFLTAVAADVAGGTAITTTATDVALGNTSEFSECFVVPVAPSACGDANEEDGVTATDALVTLKTAVGTAECELCRCDVNSANGITASDALMMLRFAVGQAVSLVCVPCV